MSRARVIALVAAPIVLVAAAAAYLLLPPWQTNSVPVPPRSATPRQVVDSYLAALDGHDCGTAKALTTASARRDLGYWCRSVAHLDRVRIGNVGSGDPRADGFPSAYSDSHVEVTFRIAWRFLHGDGSMPAGHTIWSYELVRPASGGRWLIFDQGTP